MLLKLQLPDYNRMVTGGSILQWHKAEGEWVAFGDELFDLKVEAIQVTPLPPLDVAKQIELLINAQAVPPPTTASSARSMRRKATGGRLATC